MSPCQLTCTHCNGNYFLKLRNLLTTTNIAKEYQRLQQAITVVTTDDGFSLPVPLAAKALHCAKKLLKWMAEFENKPKATTFAVTLVKLLKECSSGSESKGARVRREKIWENTTSFIAQKGFVHYGQCSLGNPSMRKLAQFSTNL